MITNKLKTRGVELLGSDCKSFTEEDPFNTQNVVEGLIGTTNDHRYGALLITSINGVSCEQLIFATPKLKYPFDRSGRYVFPSAQKIEAYTKLDGTNVFMYRYTAENKVFVSYKTRLRPFLKESRFGSFLEMWSGMLKKYPNISKLFLANPHLDGFSFELYGSLNKHLISYDVSLDTALLFGITGDAAKVVPSGGLDSLGVPTADLENKITKNYVWEYESAQDKIEEDLEETEDGFKGQEGQVWYIQTHDGLWSMFKLKPHTIENIHWASGGIPRLVIKATAYNTLETESDITKKAVVALLLEEFSQEQINSSTIRIENVVSEIAEELVFRERVGIALGMIIRPNTKIANLPTLPDVMRKLSTHFQKADMKKVYSFACALLEQQVGKEEFNEYRLVK